MQTRDILIDLAEAAIRTHGYGGFSYADLARGAGIRKASIHHHFPAKADLGLAVLERYRAQLASALETISAGQPNPAAALKALIALYRDALDEGKKMCLCTALASESLQLDSAIQRELAASNQMVSQWIAHHCANDANQALATLAQLQGAQLIARAGSDATLFDLATRALARQHG